MNLIQLCNVKKKKNDFFVQGYSSLSYKLQPDQDATQDDEPKQNFPYQQNQLNES